MKHLLAVVFAALLALPARAEEKAVPAKSGWGAFLKNLKNTLTQSAVGSQRKKGRSSQGVAAVRGSEQAKKGVADPNEPILKGDARSTKARKELGYDAELEAAVDLLAAGKTEEGLKALEAFRAEHPKHRREDVSKAIEGAKALLEGKPAAAPVPAAGE